MSKAAYHYSFDHEHLLGIDGLHPLFHALLEPAPLDTDGPAGRSGLVWKDSREPVL